MPLKLVSNSTDTSPSIARTRAGSHELVAKKLNLSEEQRKILLYANGRRTLDQLSTLVPIIEQDPDLLLDMETNGLIEIVAQSSPIPGESQQRRSAPPTRPAPEPEKAPAKPAMNANFLAGKSELTQEITRLLGAESGPAVEKINSLTTPDALAALMPKLIDLVKLYSGGAAGERFAKQFINRF